MKGSVYLRTLLLLGLHILIITSQGDEDEDTAPGCSWAGREYSNRDVWRPNPCKICVCYKGEVSCDELVCDDVTDCKKTVIPAGECCPECQPDYEDIHCSWDGHLYADRDIWKPAACRICACDKGRVFCDDIVCYEVTNCEKTVIPEGQCCPECQPNVDGGKVNEGQKTQQEDIACATGCYE